MHKRKTKSRGHVLIGRLKHAKQKKKWWATLKLITTCNDAWTRKLIHTRRYIGERDMCLEVLRTYKSISPLCECLHWGFDHPSPQNLTRAPQQGFLNQRGKYSATTHFGPSACTLWRLLLLSNRGYNVSLTHCLIVSLGSIIDLYLLIDIYEWSHMKDFTDSHHWMNYWKAAIDLI